MGKVRKVVMGDEKVEKEQQRKAEARRETKKSKKIKDEPETTDENAPVEGEEKETKKMKKSSSKSAGPKIHSKRYLEAKAMVDANKLYPLTDAIELMKKTSLTKFDGTVELHLNLNQAVLGEKKDIRGTLTLPHGTGKQIRIKIADEAIIEEITSGKITFDVLVAHPTMMPKLAKVARILGPKGLMPNPKTGTVTTDVDKKVEELSHGQVNYKTEPENPIIHLSVGKVSFEDKKLQENIETALTAIGKNKIAKATVTATMGPGIRLAI